MSSMVYFQKIDHRDKNIAAFVTEYLKESRNLKKFLNLDTLFLKINVSDFSMMSIVTQGVFKVFGEQSIQDIIRNKSRYTKINLCVKYSDVKKYLSVSNVDTGVVENIFDKTNSKIGLLEFKNMVKFLRNPLNIKMAISESTEIENSNMHLLCGDIEGFSMAQSTSENSVRLDITMNVVYEGLLTMLEFQKEGLN